MDALRLVVLLLTPLLFAVGFVVGLMNTPLFPVPAQENDLLPVNRVLMRLLTQGE